MTHFKWETMCFLYSLGSEGFCLLQIKGKQYLWSLGNKYCWRSKCSIMKNLPLSINGNPINNFVGTSTFNEYTTSTCIWVVLHILTLLAPVHEVCTISCGISTRSCMYMWISYLDYDKVFHYSFQVFTGTMEWNLLFWYGKSCAFGPTLLRSFELIVLVPGGG